MIYGSYSESAKKVRGLKLLDDVSFEHDWSHRCAGVASCATR
jgi:hypothetical protein